MLLHVYKLDRQNLKERSRRVNLEDGNKVHKMLTEACKSSRADANLLYRLVYRHDEILLYVQTTKDIDNSVMKAFGFQEVKTIDMEQRLNNLQVGDVVRFNIRVFPCHCVNEKKRYISNEQERRSWLTYKFEQHGLKLPSGSFMEKNVSMDKFTKNDRSVTIKNNEYEGYCSVTDIEAFKQLVLTGLGKCKNYGLGLLLVQ